MKLGISCAVGPRGETYWGTLAVIAETREEAVARARERLEQMNLCGDAEAMKYRQSLMENLNAR